MSTFAGKFREYPLISADNFEKENLDSLAFFLSHCHKDHMVGLDSAALYHRLKTSKTVFLYCSETTENLLMCNPTYSHLKDYIRSIPVDQQTMIPLVDEKTGQESSFCVTLLPAGHCVGSVMFLFEGPGGNVLYTGDFRLSKGDVKRISFFHTKERIKDFKSIYIDTTFCLPRMKSLPSRQQSRDAVINLIDRWFSRGPEYAVSLLCKGMYGFEYLLKEIAMNYRTKIHVSAERLAMYRYLPDMTPYFTTDGQSSKIHACKWQANQRCDSDLPCGSSVHPSLKTKVLRIKPTTMWVARSTEPMPEDFKRYDKEKRLWRVVHSMHASMEEIEDLVGYLRPYHVFPNVPPAGLDTLENDFERLKGLTRIQDCDSCNQDESVEERFKQHAAHLSGEGVTKDKKSLEEKAALRKIQLCAPPKPDERVLAQCKELGLIDDENLTPPPKRRRSRRQGIALEEKTSVPQDTQGSSSRKVIISVSQEIQGNSLGGVNTTIQKQSNEKSFGEVTTVSPQTHGELSKDVDRSVSQHAYTNGYETITEGKPMICPRVEDVQDRPTEFYENSCCPPKTEKKAEDEKPAECKVSEVLSNTVVLERTSHGKKSLDVIASYKIDHNLTADTRTTSSIPVSVVELSGSDENYDQGPVGGEPRSKADFDIPPSPGHVKPLPDKLSAIHKLLGNGESMSITNILKF